MITSSKKPHLAGLTIVLTIFAVGSPAHSQTISDWIPQDEASDWHDETFWTNGVPKAAGDQANIVSSRSVPGTPIVTAPISLGQLHLNGTVSIDVIGDSTITFDQPGGDPAILATDSRLRRNATLSTPIAIAVGESLLIDIPGVGSMHMAGPIEPGDGTITKVGSGELVLLHPQLDWNGLLSIDQGTLVVEEVNALANAQQLRVPEGVTVTFVSQDDTGQRSDDYLVPRIALDGGVLQTNRGPKTRFTDVVTNIELASDSVIKVSSDDMLRLQGPITGVGGLRFEQPYDLGNVSGGNYTELMIDGPTSYQGETHIGDIHVVFSYSEAMGDNSAGTIVDGGELELDHGGGGEQISVRGGTLWLRAADSAYAHHVAPSMRIPIQTTSIRLRS
jgi:hypothetical protein